MFNLTIGGIASRVRGAYHRIGNASRAPPGNNITQPSELIDLSTDDVDMEFLKELKREAMFWRIDRKPEGLTSERVARISNTLDLKIKGAINSGTQDRIIRHADWGGYSAYLGGVSVRQNGDYFLRIYQIRGR